MYRRARPHGLAEGLRVQLARPGGGRYLALEARHRRGGAVANGWATGERGGDRRRRAEPNAGAGTPGVCPHRMTRNTGRAQCVHTADPCNKVSQRSTLTRLRYTPMIVKIFLTGWILAIVAVYAHSTVWAGFCSASSR